MAVVGKFRAGKGSRVKVGATNLNMANWDITERGDPLDTNNFECGGLDQGLIGILACDWNFGGNWDAGRNPIDSPPGLYVREDLSSLQFYTNVLDNVGWIIGTSLVVSSKNGAQVKGLVTFSCSGKSNGGAVLPAGSV